MFDLVLIEVIHNNNLMFCFNYKKKGNSDIFEEIP